MESYTFLKNRRILVGTNVLFYPQIGVPELYMDFMKCRHFIKSCPKTIFLCWNTLVIVSLFISTGEQQRIIVVTEMGYNSRGQTTQCLTFELPLLEEGIKSGGNREEIKLELI